VNQKAARSSAYWTGGLSLAPEATRGGPTGGRVKPDSGWHLSIWRELTGDKGLAKCQGDRRDEVIDHHIYTF